jgi:MFS family permease
LLLVARGLTTFVTRPIVGRLSDMARGKIKIMTAFTFVLFGVLNLVCSFIRTFPLLLVYMALTGIVEGVWWVTYSLLAMEITGGYFFDQAFSLCSLVGAFSSLIGIPTSGTGSKDSYFSIFYFLSLFL